MGARGESRLSSFARRPLSSLVGTLTLASLAAHGAAAIGLPLTHPRILALFIAAGSIGYALRTAAHLFVTSPRAPHGCGGSLLSSCSCVWGGMTSRGGR